MKHPIRVKDFRVAAVSTNRNSFGLVGVVLIARDGTAFQVGASYLTTPRRGETLTVPYDGPALNFAALGFEIPERLPSPPAKVITEAWTDA